MPKAVLKPVPYAELVIGHWYQARFEFEDHIISAPSATLASATQSTSITRATTRNKSHRVMVLTKFADPEDPVYGRAICVFFTSFGGRQDLSTTTINTRDHLKYISVNSTPPPVPPYISIPISLGSLSGYINLADEYNLPIGRGDEAIVRMREACTVRADIHSPDWVVPYIKKLKVAWFDIATAITAEFGPKDAVDETSGCASSSISGAKRHRDEEDEKNDEVKGKGKGKGPVKRSRNAPRWLDGADDTDDDPETSEEDDGSRNISECDEPDGAGEFADDSGIHLLDFEGEVGLEVDVSGQAEIKIEKPELPIYRRWDPPTLLGVEFYEMHGDEEDIDDEVNFSLLEALFRPFPEF
ncbi:hypothetical protein Q9L58_002283 [Maublancomyces gigas]|uniref:Uncharacterized protein n=1 Tax=Discina gigas TaxID=1032678 RepID=A0ABR3GS00_9PEZI